MQVGLNKFNPKILLFIFLYSICFNNSFSQTSEHELGNWLMYFGMNKLSNKLSIHSEVQYRNHELLPNSIEQLLLRTGVNYHISKTAFITAGYGYIAGYQYESIQTKPESEEHRIWQQLILINHLGRVKFEHRYRVEQRFVNKDYRNRLRYRLMVFVPINKPKIEVNTFFIGIYDEIFLNTKQTYFDRNRLYGALGYQLNKTTAFQVGYLHQQVNDFGKHHLQFAVIFNPDFGKK